MAEEARAGIESLNAGNRGQGAQGKGRGMRQRAAKSERRGGVRRWCTGKPTSENPDPSAGSGQAVGHPFGCCGFRRGRGAGASSFAPMPMTQLDRAAIAERRGLLLAKPAVSSGGVKAAGAGKPMSEIRTLRQVRADYGAPILSSCVGGDDEMRRNGAERGADACGEGGEAKRVDGAGDGDSALVDAELYAGGDRPGRRCDV